MTSHTHSREAYECIRAEGMLSRRQAAILQWLLANPKPWSDREIAAGMGYLDMNAVRPRITELIKIGLLIEVDSVRCPVTGKTVRRVAVVFEQAELPL